MNILITGGLGIVGAGLVKELRQNGHRVVSYDLNHQHDEVGFSLKTDVETPLYARCDIGEFRQIKRVLESLGSLITSIIAPQSSDGGMAKIFTKRSGARMRSVQRTLSVCRSV
jgi:UDP-glucose 4-epimerase